MGVLRSWGGRLGPPVRSGQDLLSWDLSSKLHLSPSWLPGSWWEGGDRVALTWTRLPSAQVGFSYSHSWLDGLCVKRPPAHHPPCGPGQTALTVGSLFVWVQWSVQSAGVRNAEHGWKASFFLGQPEAAAHGRALAPHGRLLCSQAFCLHLRLCLRLCLPRVISG